MEFKIPPINPLDKKFPKKDSLQPPKKDKKPSDSKGDTIEISEEAKRLAEQEKE